MDDKQNSQTSLNQNDSSNPQIPTPVVSTPPIVPPIIPPTTPTPVSVNPNPLPPNPTTTTTFQPPDFIPPTAAPVFPPNPVPAAKKEFSPPVPPPPPSPTILSEQQVHDTTEADKIAKSEGDEYWENYAREIELEKEIAEMGGIEKVEAGQVKLSEEIAKEMGVKPVIDVQTPMSEVVSDFKIANISLADDQIMQGIKKPTTSGFRWLVEWFIYELLKAHFVVKFVKGRFVRSKGNS